MKPLLIDSCRKSRSNRSWRLVLLRLHNAHTGRHRRACYAVSCHPLPPFPRIPFRLLSGQCGRARSRAGCTRRSRAVKSVEGDEPDSDVAALVARLAVRFGEDRVYRQAPVESDVPERSVAKVPALAPPVLATWSTGLARPARLLDPPELIEVLALLPDNSPAAFIWRRVRRRIVRADRPERIAGEWWRSVEEAGTARDLLRRRRREGRPVLALPRFLRHRLFRAFHRKPSRVVRITQGLSLSASE
jgi:hypothetical protein